MERMPTGIAGLDQILGGGLPRGRTTLVVGGPGCGKTLFALQTLSQGIRRWGEPGILVSFEEGPEGIEANTAPFSWRLTGNKARRLRIIDGRAVRTAVRAGDFDLIALLAAVGHQSRVLKARRVAFDGLDVLLNMIDDPSVVRREVYRLAEWLAEASLTALVTAKTEADDATLAPAYSFLPFLADCVVVLRNRLVGRTAVRGLRVLKCRGVAHSSGESPLVIGASGLEVCVDVPADHRVSRERVSTGVPRLDTMLTGGYTRGSCTLISGAPGTSKTSLAGAFVQAACRRGERALFLSLDESGAEIVRNLASVGIRLASHVRKGLLTFAPTTGRGVAPDEQMLVLRSEIEERGVRCLVVDPMSAMIDVTNADIASDAVIRFLRFAKRRGVTVVLTSLLEGHDASVEATELSVSTVADTWMHVSYIVRGGERNRALTVVKSRGTGHSNQVRELLLSHRGITLADVYTARGDVLMGTLRVEKEHEERVERERRAREEQQRRRDLQTSVAGTRAGIERLQRELEYKEKELKELERVHRDRARIARANSESLLTLRRADGQPSRAARKAE